MRRVLPLLLAVVLTALPVRAALRPAYGGRAVAAASGPFASADPARARTDLERLLAAATACTVPELLAAPPAPSPDGRTVRLLLAPDLFFHDGTRITAADVARSLRRVLEPALSAPAAWRLLPLQGAAERLAGATGDLAVRTDGPLALELDLAVPGVDLVALLDDPRLPVVRPDGMTGCGPFRPAPDADGPGWSLVPFDRHPAGRPFLDRLTLQALDPADPDPLLEGRFDLAVGAAARRRGRAAEGLEAATVVRVEATGRRGEALRALLEAGVDRASLVRFVGGGARPLHGLGAAGPPASREATPPAAPRVDGPVTLTWPVDRPALRRVAERLQLGLHDRGVDARLATPPSGPADLVLVHVPALPGEPRARLAALLYALGAPRAAREAFEATSQALPALAGRLERALPAVPLFVEPDAVFAADALLGVRAGAACPVVPGDLWRWPPSLPEAPD